MQNVGNLGGAGRNTSGAQTAVLPGVGTLRCTNVQFGTPKNVTPSHVFIAEPGGFASKEASTHAAPKKP